MEEKEVDKQIAEVLEERRTAIERMSGKRKSQKLASSGQKLLFATNKMN